MSGTYSFYRFQDGEPASVQLSNVKAVLARHGLGHLPLSEGPNTPAMPTGPSGDTPIGELFVSISREKVDEIAIERPRYQPELRALAFDLIQSLQMVLITDGTAIYGTANAAAGLAPGFEDQFEEVNLSVKSAQELP
jgi:hypothetical protein